MKIPAKLLMTAPNNAVATLPPAAVVKMTHMLIVVGKHVKIKRPSRSGVDSSDGNVVAIKLVKGSPTSTQDKGCQ